MAEAVFSATVWSNGYRYIIDEQEEMVRIGYREEGQDPAYDVGHDVLIAPSDLEAVARTMLEVARLNAGSEA